MPNFTVVARNHMDLTWRRCFESYFTYGGHVIRPYAEIEEHQLDWWLDVGCESGMVYEIEQTITIRKYLERNPSRAKRVKELADSGKLRFLGGGEAVIDYNMTDGESIVRNHFYSRRYLAKNYGVTPKFAACPDTFGLSAGLPQFFRQLGYPAIALFNRLFRDGKPVWEGISGHQVAIETAKYPDARFPEGTKYPACTACCGEGCAVCHGAGIDINYRYQGKHLDQEFSSQMPVTEGDLVFLQGSEELIESDNLMANLQAYADENGYTLKFAGCEDVIEERYAGLLKAVREGTVPPEWIDDRPEGNPFATGCCVSRIRIKQENRRLEAALQSAERLCALARSITGADYPAETLEQLWITMRCRHPIQMRRMRNL